MFVKKAHPLLLFGFPFMLWGFCYHGFLSGRALISEDTFAIYALVKYFWDSISTGQFPYWNPFLSWGMGHLRQFGEFNPFWLLTWLMQWVGVKFYVAFIWTIVLYYFLGALGFYFLLQRLLRHAGLAYFGFWGLLFSSIGMSLFAQLSLVLIFVPSVWFFYFFVDFLESWRPASAVCLTFMMMLIATTYLPFYFITVFLFFIIATCLCYPKEFLNSIKGIFCFAARYPGVTGVCLLGLAVSLVSPFLCWLSLKSDFLALARPIALNYEDVKQAGIPIVEVMRDYSLFAALISGLCLPVLSQIRDLFPLNHIPFYSQRIMYVPLAVHVLFLCFAFVSLNRRIMLAAVLTFVIFLAAIAKLMPFYRWLFEHLAYFHMFRNIFFLMPFLIASYIWLALEQARVGLEAMQRWRFWPSVAGAAKGLGIVLFLWLGIWQPLSVLRGHYVDFKNVNSPIVAEALQQGAVRAHFEYMRGAPAVKEYSSMDPNELYRLYNWYIISQKDAPGFITNSYGYPPPWSYALVNVLPMPGFEEYIRHKFVLYDSIQAVPIKDLDPQRFKYLFGQNPRVAYVAADQGVSAPGAGHVQFLEKDSDQWKILHFDVNHLVAQADFSNKKFLVYNDSFSPQWKALINDKPVEVARANFAYKGIWVPAGKAVVRFEFVPWGGRWLGFFMMGFFYMFCGYSVYQLFQQAKRPTYV